jgi:hypothetical protein
MKPEAKVWRKAQRAALKGVSKGRRTTHLVRTQEPTRGSSWQRRHPDETSPWIKRRLAGAR